MALETSTNLPAVEDFTLLSAHQQETPVSFFSARAVLHLRCPAATIRISSDDLSSQPVLASLQSEDALQTSEDGTDVTIAGIDVWIASNQLILGSSARTTSVLIPYQTITVHAQEGHAVLLGLNLSDANTADEDLVFIQLRIIPSEIESFEKPTENGSMEHTNGDIQTGQSSAQALFKAIADCQELNPDPPEDSDEAFDETAPGATGWITSENMQEFLDEDGQFRVPEGTTIAGEGEAEDSQPNEPHWPLGQGAGRTRTADEADGVEGADTETKWQRTG